MKKIIQDVLHSISPAQLQYEIKMFARCGASASWGKQFPAPSLNMVSNNATTNCNTLHKMQTGNMANWNSRSHCTVCLYIN